MRNRVLTLGLEGSQQMQEAMKDAIVESFNMDREMDQMDHDVLQRMTSSAVNKAVTTNVTISSRLAGNAEVNAFRAFLETAGASVTDIE